MEAKPLEGSLTASSTGSNLTQATKLEKPVGINQQPEALEGDLKTKTIEQIKEPAGMDVVDSLWIQVEAALKSSVSKVMLMVLLNECSFRSKSIDACAKYPEAVEAYYKKANDSTLDFDAVKGVLTMFSAANQAQGKDYFASIVRYFVYLTCIPTGTECLITFCKEQCRASESMKAKFEDFANQYDLLCANDNSHREQLKSFEAARGMTPEQMKEAVVIAAAKVLA